MHDIGSRHLGPIVARRLHNNGISGDLFGGIYATRVANYLGISPGVIWSCLPLI